MVNLSKVKTCPECGSDNVKYVEKEKALYCNDCGEIFEQLPKKGRKEV